jgi:hypothetical protein
MAKAIAVGLVGSALVVAVPGTAGAEVPPEPEIEKPWGGPTSQHVWIDAQAGVEYINLQTFNADFKTVSVGLLPTSATGPTANVGAGVRLVFLTLGVRGRVASFQDSSPLHDAGAWQVWTLDGEVGLRVPLGRFEPHVAIAGGYTSFGGFETAVNGLSAGLDVHGIDARLDAGADYWITHQISVGVGASGGLLGVARPGVAVGDLIAGHQVATLNEAKARVDEANGTSFGWTFALTGDLGVHF